jgi:hypothetical protein
MPSAPLHTVLPPLLRTTSALLTELAGQGAVVRGEAACGIAADNLLTGRRPSSSSQACPEAPSVGPAACTGAARGTVGLTVTCLEPCPCRVNQSSLAAAPYPTRADPLLAHRTPSGHAHAPRLPTTTRQVTLATAAASRPLSTSRARDWLTLARLAVSVWSDVRVGRQDLLTPVPRHEARSGRPRRRRRGPPVPGDHLPCWQASREAARQPFMQRLAPTFRCQRWKSACWSPDGSF